MRTVTTKNGFRAERGGENINEIWVFDVKSVDDTEVVFNDGSTRLRRGSYIQFWTSEADARAALILAKRVLKDGLRYVMDQASIMQNIANGDVTVKQKN